MEVCAKIIHVYKLAELGLLTAMLIMIYHNFKINVVNH